MCMQHETKNEFHVMFSFFWVWTTKVNFVVSKRTLKHTQPPLPHTHTHTHPRVHARPTNYTHTTRPSGYRQSPMGSARDRHVTTIMAPRIRLGSANLILGENPSATLCQSTLGFKHGQVASTTEALTTMLQACWLPCHVFIPSSRSMQHETRKSRLIEEISITKQGV
jgi:hypothetical protein